MKTIKVAAAFFLFVAVASCKKNNDKKANCRIVTLTQTSSSGTVIQNYTYNNEGRILTVNTSGANGGNKVFTYLGNTVIAISSQSDGSFASRDSITLDAKRRPLNIRQFFSEQGDRWANNSFEYNGDDLQKIHLVNESGTQQQTSVATMVNGNMVSLVNDDGNSTLEYFTDKKVQQGDFLELSSFSQYGLSVYPHKNLVKTIASNSNIINFNYDFNTDGTISRVTATTGGTVVTISYQYQCN
jgi:hypothetical protein